MTELSPAAQVVLTAYNQRELATKRTTALVAALRAAAKQSIFADVAVNKTIEVVPVDILLAIATELEGKCNG
jgi:hypothetical protein